MYYFIHADSAPVWPVCDVYFSTEPDLKALHIATDKLYDKVYVNE